MEGPASHIVYGKRQQAHLRTRENVAEGSDDWGESSLGAIWHCKRTYLHVRVQYFKHGPYGCGYTTWALSTCVLWYVPVQRIWVVIACWVGERRLARAS